MPTYDYICQNCGYRIEVFQSIKEEPLTKCMKCGMTTLKRVISGGAGLIFKGSGFYLTDYKNKKKKSEIKQTKEMTEKKTTDKKATGEHKKK